MDFDHPSQNINEKPSRALAFAAFPKGSLQACYQQDSAYSCFLIPDRKISTRSLAELLNLLHFLKIFCRHAIKTDLQIHSY